MLNEKKKIHTIETKYMVQLAGHQHKIGRKKNQKNTENCIVGRPEMIRLRDRRARSQHRKFSHAELE